MKIRKEQGITLVALMITIIVLIILAAVTIKSVYNHAIVGKATEGTEEYAKEQEREKNEIDKVASILDKITNPSTNPGEKTTLGEVYTDDMIGQKITYTANGQSEWIVFGKDESGNVLITTKEPVAANHEVQGTVEAWLDYEDNLNNACSVYGGTIQGKEVNARSITLKDINYVSGVEEPEWDEYTFGTEKDYANKKVDYFYPKKGVTTTYNGYEYVNWMKATNEEQKSVIKNNAYAYGYNGGELTTVLSDKTKELNITGLRENNLKYIFGTDENVYNRYWVASPTVSVQSSAAEYNFTMVRGLMIHADDSVLIASNSNDERISEGDSRKFTSHRSFTI